MSTSVQLSNGNEIPDAISRLRNDNSPEDWVLVGHQNGNPNILELVGTGSNGINELGSKLSEDQVQYALLRLTNKIDLSITVKFVFIYNFADRLSFVKKGRFGVVKGDATRYFQPFHVATEIGSPKDLKEYEIRELVEEAAGNANKVRDANFVEGRQVRGYTARMQSQNESLGVTSVPSTQNPNLYVGSNISKATTETAKVLDKQTSSTSLKFSKSVGVVSTQSQELSISEELSAAISNVHKDTSEIKWVVAGYDNEDVKKQLVLYASGTESADEIPQYLQDDKIRYGIIRDTDFIDGHPTTKFAFFEFIGANVGFVKRGKVTTHKGAIHSKFEPFHVEFSLSKAKEIDQSIVHNKISYYSGSKSNVR